MRPKIYVAHAYGRRHNLSFEQCEQNVKDCIRNFTLPLMDMGYNPFTPLLEHYIYEDNWVNAQPEDEVYERVSAWIKDCSKFLVAKNGHWENSGVDREIQIALRYGLSIYYSLDSVPDLRDER